MNEYNIKVNLERGLIINSDIYLVQNDYNSTIFNFEFDNKYKNYTKIFQLQYPNGTIWKQEIKDNKVTLANFDDEGNPISILVQTGKYYFDIAVYDNDSKLTTTEKVYFNVREEITGEDIELDDRLPVLDNLINTVNKNITETDNLNISLENNILTITKKDGTTKSENVKGDDYIITEEDYQEIETQVKEDIQPILENNLKEAKDYTDNAIVKDFKDISFDTTTMTFVFTRHDNTTFTVDLPIEQTVKNGYYDEDTKELVLVLVSDQEIRIPATGLIDDYTGVDSATIQVVISADNKITCNIISGSITKTLLTTELQEELNGKLNSNLVEQKDLLVTYEDETTETIKLVVYK